LGQFKHVVNIRARKYTVFSATVIALSSLLQTLLTEVERLDFSFGAHRGEWAYWGRWWRITRSQRKQGTRKVSFSLGQFKHVVNIRQR
jgi:hypothetical protein